MSANFALTFIPGSFKLVFSKEPFEEAILSNRFQGVGNQRSRKEL